MLGVYLGFISTETGPNWRNATKHKNPGSLTAQHFAGIHGNWRNKTIIIRNQQVAYDKLSSMVTGTVYGEEAVAPYANGGGVYDCSFTGGLSTLEFDGANSAIKGYDAAGNEIFSHTYHYVGMEEIRGLYEYESDDADSGEFTYFCMAPDTNTTTYHIEFRYGSDLDALGQYDAGPYAYWLASGISTDYDQTMIENCIELFCTENLSA